MKNENIQKIAIDTIKNSLLSAALNISKPIYNNFNITLSRNVHLYNPLELEDYNKLEMGIGIKSMEKIEKNREIMTIPIVSGLNGIEMLDIKNDENLKILKSLISKIAISYAEKPVDNKSYEIKPIINKIDNFKYEKMLQTQSLIWQIIVNNLNERSYNYDLVNSFPKDELTQVAFFNKNIIDNMSSVSLKLFYSETISAYKYIYDLILQQGIFEVSQELFLWAYSNVLARKISILDHYSDLDSPNNKESNGKPIELIAPIIEYINHSGSNSNVLYEPDYDFETKQSVVRLYSTREIEAGEQLLLDYCITEKFNNRQLMNRYGFFDITNPNKNIEIPFLMEDVFIILDVISQKIIVKFLKLQKNEKIKSFKNNLLKKANLSDYEMKFSKLTIYENKFDLELMKYLRIAFLDESDLSDEDKKGNLISFDFSKKYNDGNEKCVLEFCINILEKYNNYVKSNDYSKKIEQIGTIINKEQFMYKNMYLLEKEEKDLLEKNLKFLNKKLNTLI